MEDKTNPKDLLGVKKVSITKLPAVAIAWAAMAMMDGAKKYGPYNWREKKVRASIYIDAAFRHLTEWFEGQERAEDSNIHHLGHAMACCAILLDAQANGCLEDDRPSSHMDTDWYASFLNSLRKDIEAKAENAIRKETIDDTPKLVPKPGALVPVPSTYASSLQSFQDRENSVLAAINSYIAAGYEAKIEHDFAAQNYKVTLRKGNIGYSFMVWTPLQWEKNVKRPEVQSPRVDACVQGIPPRDEDFVTKQAERFNGDGDRNG